ncbi:MAG: MerR family transcriptional regulator [Syntrophobacter sp.]
MDAGNHRALYPIGIVAELVGVTPRTLRVYEQEGLIKPSRRGGKRFYSNNDLEWLHCLRKLVTEKGLNLTGVKKLLTLAPCWSIRNCPEEHRKSCPAVLDLPIPCWEIKHRCSGPEVPCSECEVYVGKTKLVMAKMLSGKEEN